MIPRRFALLGDPVAHSKSPAMHQAAFRTLGMPHSYEALRATSGELPVRVGELRAGTFHGFNVTAPHKQAILEWVDALHPSVAMVGAANTLVRAPDGAIVAHNTDALALAEELREFTTEVGSHPRVLPKAIVLGSGGAARSAVVALGALLGVSRLTVRARAWSIFGRSDAFVREMQDRMANLTNPPEIVAEPWIASPVSEAEATLVIQATSSGMIDSSATEDVARVIAWGSLPPGAAVMDLVYAPAETRFMRTAATHGFHVRNGLGMLVRQGAVAFELWLGVPAPRDAMMAAIV